MIVSLIKVLQEGGCYWERQLNSPGHALAIPSGTQFKIAVEGPSSHRFVNGVCEDGSFLVQDEPHAGQRFLSANEAVNAVREPSSNAFLHIHFRIGSQWVTADVLRRREDYRCDEAEEDALQMAIEAVRKQLKLVDSHLEQSALLRKAAEVVQKNPDLLQEAKRRRQWLKDFQF